VGLIITAPRRGLSQRLAGISTLRRQSLLGETPSRWILKRTTFAAALFTASVRIVLQE